MIDTSIFFSVGIVRDIVPPVILKATNKINCMHVCLTVTTKTGCTAVLVEEGLAEAENIRWDVNNRWTDRPKSDF